MSCSRDEHLLLSCFCNNQRCDCCSYTLCQSCWNQFRWSSYTQSSQDDSLRCTTSLPAWHYTNDAWWRVWHANIMSQSWNVNTRAQPDFNWETCILACHTSPSCIICFVASLTKIRLNSKYIYIIKNLLARNHTIIMSPQAPAVSMQK